MESQEDIVGPRSDFESAGLNDGRLVDSRLCRKCKYDLRGVEASGVCPECGKPVAESISGPLLKYGPVSYVKRLLRGNALAGNGLLAVILGSLLVAALSGMAGEDGIDQTAAFMILGATGLVVAGGVSFGAGWWFIAGADDRAAGARSTRLQKAVRVSAAVYVIALCTAFASGFVQGLIDIGLPVIDLVATSVSTLAWVSVFLFGARFLKGISNRIPDQIAERQSGGLWFVLLYVLAGYGVVALGIVLSFFMPMDDSDELIGVPMMLILAGSLGAGLMLLMALIRYARLASRLRKGLKSVLAQMP